MKSALSCQRGGEISGHTLDLIGWDASRASAALRPFSGVTGVAVWRIVRSLSQ
jgi:hypothetical protein